MSSTALLLLDYQVAMCDSGPYGLQPPLAVQVAEREVIARAQKALTTAREIGLFVVHVRLAFDSSYELRTNASARFAAYAAKRAMLAGSPEAAFVEELSPLDTEPIVTKGGVDPFIGTPLLEVLVRNGVSRVALAGVATNAVVESAARHATDSGLQVVVLEDLCASFSEAMHEFAISHTLPMFADVRDSESFLLEMSA